MVAATVLLLIQRTVFKPCDVLRQGALLHVEKSRSLLNLAADSAHLSTQSASGAPAKGCDRGHRDVATKDSGLH